jgi:chemotaxis protein methyltransferase CheR
MAKSPGKKGSVTAADSELEDLELELLLEALYRFYGYDFRDYERRGVKRRIRECMLEARVPSIPRLQERILREPGLFEKLVRRFSAAGAPMFADASYFNALRSKILPMLRTYPLIRIWHVGCATGEEVYALAILLQEEGIYPRCRIYATDLSGEAVRHAKKGSFLAAKLDDYASNYARAGNTRSLNDYMRVRGRRILMNAALKKNIVFCEHNLVTDGSLNEFQLIVCRDVLVNFNQNLRTRVDHLIYESLSRFGVLVLGGSDSITMLQHQTCYVQLDDACPLYQKMDGVISKASA